ncbi:MAG: homocysteine S-methyltransferase family protein [Planctomycetes bacterium]|nr:homocysteine S-methyltransferase family protein [Planctomycetota bacterium]
MSLLARLRAGETLVADGAMGSMLMQRGLEAGACPEALNLSRPELLEEIARLYLEAGADLVQTNSFGGSPAKLERYGLEPRCEEVNRAAVAAVRRAVGERALIYGSCGPCGRLLKPLGDAEPDEVRDGFLRQMRALVAEGVDALCVETMTDLAEATLAVEAAREAAAEAGREVPVMATMTFDRTRRGYFTIMGIDIATAAAGLARAGADVVGSNCGNGSDNMVEIAREFRDRTALPLLIQPNAGLPRLEGGRAVYAEGPEYMAERAHQLLVLGVALIGGCCGTAPEHTRALRRLVSSPVD